MSNIAQSLTRNGAPIDAKLTGSKIISLGPILVIILVISLLGGFTARFAEGVLHFVRAKLVAIAVPSIANESATACW